jgi:transcriptional regulator NrdR family protein
LVYDSREERGRLLRRRQCTACDARWNTIEGPEVVWSALIEAEEKLAAAGVAIAAARSIVSGLKAFDPETVRHAPRVVAGE